MDALRLLDEQHEEITRLLDEVRSADGDEREERFARLADAITSHTRLEEQVFYPSVAAVETERILVASLDHHLAMKRAIARLRRLPADGARFASELEQLRLTVGRHVESERRELFPKVRRLLDPEQRDALGEDLVIAGVVPGPAPL